MYYTMYNILYKLNGFPYILKVCFGARFGLEGSKDPLWNRSFWTEDMMLFKEGRQFTFKPLHYGEVVHCGGVISNFVSFSVSII